MTSKLGILGLATGLLLAAPGIANAHGHHNEGRHVRQGAHRHATRHDGRHHVRHDGRHHVRHDRRHGHAPHAKHLRSDSWRRHHVRHHRHVRDDRRGRHRLVIHDSYWCEQCRRAFRRQERFFRHLHRDHGLRRHRLWRRLVHTGWGWVFYG